MPPRLIGIVAASGGPQALEVILDGLPHEFPLPILVVQAMPDAFLDGFVAWLSGKSRLPVDAVEDGQVPEPGKVYVAGTDRYLLIEKNHLRQVERDPRAYNAMDILFGSMARELGPGAIAVILTGMSADGAEGMKEVRDAGGYTIAQDEATSLIYGTPRFAVRLGAVCESFPLQGIAPRLLELVTRSHAPRERVT